MFLVGLTFVSCSKQVITPTENSDEPSSPVWRSAAIGGAVISEGDDGSSTEGSSIIDPKDRNNNHESVFGDGEILDPTDRKND